MTQWQRWIDRAYRDIQRHYSEDVYATFKSDDVDDVVVRAVTAHARAWRETQEDRYSVAVDDGREERTYSRDPGIFTMPEWAWDELDPDSTSGAFSVDPYYDRTPCRDGYDPSGMWP